MRQATFKMLWFPNETRIYRLLCLMRIKTRHVKTIYWLRSLRNTHTRKHSRNPGSNSSQAPNKQLIVKTKRKPWPCLVMKLNFITIAWNFGFLEYSSSHSRGIKAKIRPRKNYKINLFKFPVLHTRCFTEWWSVVALEVYSGDSVICHSSSWLDFSLKLKTSGVNGW